MLYFIGWVVVVFTYASSAFWLFVYFDYISGSSGLTYSGIHWDFMIDAFSPFLKFLLLLVANFVVATTSFAQMRTERSLGKEDRHFGNLFVGSVYAIFFCFVCLAALFVALVPS